MENKELKKSIPVELTENELNLIAGGSNAIPSLPLPADAILVPAPPSGIDTGSTADLVTVCQRCRQRTSADMLYTYKDKKVCRACWMSLG